MSDRRKHKYRGRQKVEMKKMMNGNNLCVTFSKRRNEGGAAFPLVVFSPGEKVFSFGYPDVDVLVHRYLTRAPPQYTGTMQLMEAHHTANVCELNTQLTHMNNRLDNERKRSKELNRLRKVNQTQFWWACPIEEMNAAQLEQFKIALEDLKKKFARHTNNRLVNQI